jgi:hypothetical protein
LAYKNFETFRNIVHGVFNFIIQIVQTFINFFIGAWNSILPAINAAITVAKFFGADLQKLERIGLKSLGGVGEATNQTEQDLKNLERQALSTAGALRLVVTPEDQLKTQSDRYTAIALSLGKMVDYTGKGYKAIASGGGAVETAAQKLEKYIDAVKGVTQAQRGLRDANKQVDESNKTLLERTNALREAQRKFNLITNGYGKESKQAKDADNERSKAERAAERAKYALEEAIFAVKEAEQELAKVRLDPASTPQMIREAEIKLAQSKLSVADATDSQRESSEALTAAQQRLNEAVNGAEKGSEAYKDALDDLLSAEKAQADALDARTSAYERLADAVEAVTEAEKKQREAGKGVSAEDKAAADANATKTFIPDIVSGGGFTTPLTQEQLDDLSRVGRGDFGIPMLSEKEIEELFKMFPPIFMGGGIGTLMGDGGIVTKATSIIAGERGAEAIIPLDRMGSMGSTYNISVTAGMGADGKDIGTQIVNALKRYERTNGALPLTVA